MCEIRLLMLLQPSSQPIHCCFIFVHTPSFISCLHWFLIKTRYCYYHHCCYHLCLFLITCHIFDMPAYNLVPYILDSLCIPLWMSKRHTSGVCLWRKYFTRQLIVFGPPPHSREIHKSILVSRYQKRRTHSKCHSSLIPEERQRWVGYIECIVPEHT